MANIVFLTKNYFRIFFKKFSNKFASKIPLFGIILLFGGIFIASFTFLSYNTIITAIKAGIPTLALFSMSMTILMFTCMLIVTESSPVNKSNDEELLLSLPFTKAEIIASKGLYYLIFDLVLILVLLLPSYIVYYVIVDGTNILIIFRAVYVILCATLLASGISSLFRIFFTKISSRFRHSNVIKSLLSITLMIAFLIVYFIFSFISQDVKYAGKIYGFYPIKLITDFIINGNMASLIIITMIGLIVFGVSIFISSLFLGKSGKVYHNNNLELSFKEKSILNSLYKREINKYLSIPIYVTNTAFSSIITLILGFIILIVGKDYFINTIEIVIASGYENGMAPTGLMENINSYFNYMIIMSMGLMLGVAPTTGASISLEGKELWILKTHPVSYKDVFKAKILVNVVVEGLPAIIAGVLISIRIGIIYLPFLILIPLIISIITGIIGLYSNLLLPKLQWESEQEVIKQGSSVLVTMALSSVSIILPSVLFFVINHYEIIKLSIVLLAYMIIMIIWIYVLNIHGKKLYNKIV